MTQSRRADGQRLQVDVQRYNQWSTNVTEYKRNVHEDIQGSSTWYTRQESGYNANRHEYSTWGNNTKAPSYNCDSEYRATKAYYTGHPYDGSLNLYFAENRFYDPETGSWLSPDQPQDRYSPAMQSRERSYYPKYACADTNYTLSDFEHDLDSFCAGMGSELVKLLYGYAGEVYIFSAEMTNLYLWGRPIDIAELNRIHQEKAEWIAKRIIEMDMKGEMPSEGALLGGKLTADLIGMGAGLGAAGYGGGQMIGGATMAIVAPGVGTVAVVSAIPTGALIYVAGSGGFLYAGNEFKENIDKAEENEGEADSKRVYEPSPKHDPQGGWGSENPIPNDEVGQELLDSAYSSSKNKQLYNIYEGDVIKFQPDSSSGKWHAYKVSNTAKEVPTDVYKKMLEDGLINKTEYNKLIKNNW